MMGARDITGAAGAGAEPGGGLDHGADHLGVLAHAEIVVRAPDHDIARTLGRMPDGMRKPSGDPLEIGENPVAPLIMEATKGGTEILAVVHRKSRQFDARSGPEGRLRPFLRAFPAWLSSRNPSSRGAPAVTMPISAAPSCNNPAFRQ